jgi:hypothetical protein
MLVLRHWGKGMEDGDKNGGDDGDGYRQVHVIDSLVLPQLSPLIVYPFYVSAGSFLLQSSPRMERGECLMMPFNTHR